MGSKIVEFPDRRPEMDADRKLVAIRTILEQIDELLAGESKARDNKIRYQLERSRRHVEWVMFRLLHPDR